VLGYHPESKRMMLLATQPGVTVEQVIEHTGFELLLGDPSKRTRLLRTKSEDSTEEVDKDCLYI
jgi:acyl CoA:acetate/3-ketoacid CoA transferase beta subunit